MGCDSDGCEVGRCNYLTPEGDPGMADHIVTNFGTFENWSAFTNAQDKRIAELEAQLAEAGAVLGKICVASTLDPTESFIDPPEHAAMSAMLDMIGERNIALAALADAQKALARVRFLCSAEGHAPCRCGGIDKDGVCANTCICDWPRLVLEAITAPPGKEEKP